MLVLGDECDEAARESLEMGRHTIHQQFFTISENERDMEDVTPWRMFLWRDMNTEAHLHVALFQRVVMADRIALVATY